MTKRTRKFLLLLGLVVLGGAAVALGFLVLLTRALSPLAPADYTRNAAAAFSAEFPPIYHFLASNEDYDAIHFHVQHYLSGCWGKLTLTRKEGATNDREAVAARLRERFQDAGWQPQAEPNMHIPISDDDLFFGKGPNPLAPEDLKYSHPRLPDEQGVSHNCRVFISDDAAEIVAYCEMCW
jgi:hypothetical protein